MALYIQATKNGQDYILTPTEDIPIRLDISSVENGEIGSIFGDLSQSFTFAATEEHNRFFESAFTVGGQVIPGTASKIQVTVNDDTQTLLYGSMLLDSWNEENRSYSCSITSGIGDLSSSLEGMKLVDADWTAETHSYTMENAFATNSGTEMPSYFYPLIDFGFDSEGRPRVPDDEMLPNVADGSTYNSQPNYYNIDFFGRKLRRSSNNTRRQQTNSLIEPSIYFGEIATGDVVQGYITHPMTPLRVDQLLPAVQVNTVLEKIFAQAGATFESTLMDQIQDMYILPKATTGLGFEGAFEDDKGFISVTTGTYAIPDINKNNSADKSSGDRTIWTYGDNFTIQESFNPGDNFNDGVYTAPETGTYEFQFEIGLDNQVGFFDNTFNNAYWNGRISITVDGEEGS